MALMLRCPSILERISHSLVLRLIWPSRLSCTTNSGTRSVDGIFFDEHAPLVEAARRLHEQVGVALGDRAELGGDARLERNSPWLQIARA